RWLEEAAQARHPHPAHTDESQHDAVGRGGAARAESPRQHPVVEGRQAEQSGAGASEEATPVEDGVSSVSVRGLGSRVHRTLLYRTGTNNTASASTAPSAPCVPISSHASCAGSNEYSPSDTHDTIACCTPSVSRRRSLVRSSVPPACRIATGALLARPSTAGQYR